MVIDEDDGWFPVKMHGVGEFKVNVFLVLAEMGEISRLEVGTGSARFDPNVEEPHHQPCSRAGGGCTRGRAGSADK